MPRVYPRVCGGTGREADGGLLRPGSIPACAGEPYATEREERATRVYPRVCGGTMIASSQQITTWGLSPRVRGNRSRSGYPSDCSGSIPACAGEPALALARTAPPGVYPRVCGGTSTCSSSNSAARGLSPRVRGNRFAKSQPYPFPGSIPACAGEPTLFWLSCRMERVYPRVCGGTSRMASRGTPRPGLSPRVRGNHVSRDELRRLRGSIPACAGEPQQPKRNGLLDRVYPRVCGGTSGGQPIHNSGEGLSPRVRGNPNELSEENVNYGSIPACAGEPKTCIGRNRIARVYPRVCGGTPRRRL